jgi:uncharacterized membrane protein
MIGFVRRVRLALLLASVLPVALLLAACGSGDSSLDVVDPGAVPANPTFDQVFAIVQRDCAPCHDQGGTDPPYDTCEDLVAYRGDLAVEVLEKNTMPPGAWPRLTSGEKLILRRWITQGADAPCN